MVNTEFDHHSTHAPVQTQFNCDLHSEAEDFLNAMLEGNSVERLVIICRILR